MNRRPNTAALSLMAMALSLGMMPPTAYQTRRDPDREKTPEDLERMTKAEEKRRRKAAKCNTP